MKLRRGKAGAVAAFTVFTLGLALPAGACIWDEDTIRMEEQTFPVAENLIAGKFVRHSPAYYEWRKQDRLAKLDGLPANAPLGDRLRLRDDLAVAYDKLGDHELAIETARETLSMQPGRYESIANLGTFYIHGGHLEKGLWLIKEAIRINPDAHFGRERYQQYLVEYVLYRRKEGDGSLPLRRTSEQSPIRDFAYFLALRQSGWKPDQMPNGIQSHMNKVQHKAAIKGIEGMMHFGNFKSPILLEALGDVVSAERGERSHRTSGATWKEKLLTAMAYLQAARLSPEREKALDTYFTSERNLKLLGSPKITVSDVSKKLLPLLSEGKDYYAEIEANEEKWIAEGGNVDQKFAKVYYKTDSSTLAPVRRTWHRSPPGAFGESPAGFGD